MAPPWTKSKARQHQGRIFKKLCMMRIWFSIQEGDDVYFDCAIEANPRVHEIVWKHNVSITPVITYISISHYHPICITTIVIVHSWVFCFQGNILGRNSAGLIMNEGNLILQQVTKDSAGRRMIAHRWWWWNLLWRWNANNLSPFWSKFWHFKPLHSCWWETLSLVQINIWIQILNISSLHNVCWS